MNNKPIILLLLIFTIISCKKRTNSIINESELKGKTFSQILENQKDTIPIEFIDSTFSLLDYLYQDNTPWRIAKHDNLNFLVLGDKVSIIEKISDGEYNCTFIGQSDINFKIIERKPKWKKELIYGTWIKKEDIERFHYSMNDSILKPPLPYVTDGFSEKDFKSPGYFEISNDSIKYFQNYSRGKSNFIINNTNEYLVMDMKNNFIGETNWQWYIKNLSDEEMVVQRKVSDFKTSSYKTDTLIRIKR
jgi:hypothetical protein